ncbi:MAG: hypothetical protein M3Q80_01270 [bacterium]|nr:hypothetical protein [bacterium]
MLVSNKLISSKGLNQLSVFQNVVPPTHKKCESELRIGMVTVKKHPKSPLAERHHVSGWLWHSPTDSELVFRSPMDFTTWVNREDRAVILKTLTVTELAFLTERGSEMHRPVQGLIAWKTIGNHSRRYLHKYMGYGWHHLVYDRSN